MNKTTNILIAGVGGQGTLLASRVLGRYAAEKGYDCKLSEVHGMAQRGGSVVTYVRFGDKVYAPIIDEGDADYLLAFEQLEALRWVHCLKAGGTLIVNSQRIMPLPVIIGAADYPEDIDARLRARNVKLHSIDAMSAALDCGTVKAANTVILGKLTAAAGLDEAVMREALLASVPAKAVEVNRKAFERGLKL